MRAQAAIATALLAAVAIAPAADAAPKKKKPKPAPPACNLVKDGTGDVSRRASGDVPTDVFQEDKGLDAIGGDIATGAKTATAVIRLAGAPKADPTYVSRYIVEFSVAGLPNKVVLAAGVGMDATTYSWGYATTDAATGNSSYSYPGTATGSIDGSTVKITAALADLAGNENIGPIKKGAKISGIVVSTKRRLPPLTASPRGQLVNADEAVGKVPYTAGQSSCLKPA